MIKNSRSNLYFLSGIIMILGVFILSSMYKRETFYNWSLIRSEVKDTVLAIQDDYQFSRNLNCPDEKNVTNELSRRRWLMDYSTRDELVHLLDYPDGRIIATALQGLLLKNDTSIIEHIVKVLYDTTEFIWDEWEDNIVPVGVYSLRHTLGLDSIVFKGSQSPRSYCNIIEYDKQFTRLEILYIDSLYNVIDYDNHERFQEYIDYR